MLPRYSRVAFFAVTSVTLFVAQLFGNAELLKLSSSANSDDTHYPTIQSASPAAIGFGMNRSSKCESKRAENSNIWLVKAIHSHSFASTQGIRFRNECGVGAFFMVSIADTVRLQL